MLSNLHAGNTGLRKSAAFRNKAAAGGFSGVQNFGERPAKGQKKPVFLPFSPDGAMSWSAR
jgi:hypothetical protein